MNTVTVQLSTFDAIMSASPLVQLTLLILIMLSIICWAVAYFKYSQFSSLTEANRLFLGKFEKAGSLDEVNSTVDNFAGSNLARLFKAAYAELKKLADSNLAEKFTTEGHPRLSGLDNIERVLRKSMDTEIAAMESRLTWLATTGSTGPFIGLFGTVWGIMSSFHKIGQTGSASLAVVAPGISEALVATAIGLGAAIPAVALYNHFISKIKKHEMEMNNFSSDFLNLAKRNFFKE